MDLGGLGETCFICKIHASFYSSRTTILSGADISYKRVLTALMPNAERPGVASRTNRTCLLLLSSKIVQNQLANNVALCLKRILHEGVRHLVRQRKSNRANDLSVTAPAHTHTAGLGGRQRKTE